jgi:hypothetical protein
MLRSSLITSGAVRTMWALCREPGAYIVDGQPHSSGRWGSQHRHQDVIVLDRVVLGQLQQDALEGQCRQQRGALGGEQGGR